MNTLTYEWKSVKLKDCVEKSLLVLLGLWQLSTLKMAFHSYGHKISSHFGLNCPRSSSSAQNSIKSLRNLLYTQEM
jgi:hypothetical protein